MTFHDLKRELEQANRDGVERQGVIVYSQSNWEQEFSLESRSYVVSSNNRRFQEGKIANSMFGSSLDGSDMGVRLDLYNWEIDYCYMLD